MKTRMLVRAALCAASCLVVCAGSALANNGRYLPNTLNLGGLNNLSYFPPGPAVEYDADVNFSDCAVGKVHFTYDLWNGNSVATGALTGGACLAGGLEQNPDLRVADGCSLGWVQIVSATISGTNEWGAPNGTWFPDTNGGRTTPLYPFQSLPVGAANPPVSPAFQDFPNRFPSSGNQSWRAELALCVLNASAMEVCIIGSFTWGFDVNVANPKFRPSAPGAWNTGGSSQLLSTLTDAFDGNGLTGGAPASSSSWFVHQDCTDCLSCVPAPATGMMAVAGLVAVGRRRRTA